MDNPKFKIFAGNNEQFYFRLQAENGEPILSHACFKGVLVRKWGHHRSVETPMQTRIQRWEI